MLFSFLPFFGGKYSLDKVFDISVRWHFLHRNCGLILKDLVRIEAILSFYALAIYYLVFWVALFTFRIDRFCFSVVIRSALPKGSFNCMVTAAIANGFHKWCVLFKKGLQLKFLFLL